MLDKEQGRAPPCITPAGLSPPPRVPRATAEGSYHFHQAQGQLPDTLKIKTRPQVSRPIPRQLFSELRPPRFFSAFFLPF